MIQKQLATRVVAAARRYERWAPWEEFDDTQALALELPDEPQPIYAVVLGAAGQTFGLALYRGDRALEQLRLVSSDPKPPVVATMLLLAFDPPGAVPEAFREITRAAGVTDRVIPVFYCVDPGTGRRQPKSQELRLFVQAIDTLLLADERDLLRPRRFKPDRECKLLTLTARSDGKKITDVTARYVDVPGTAEPAERAPLPEALLEAPLADEHWIVGLEPSPADAPQQPEVLAVIDAANGRLLGMTLVLPDEPGELDDAIAAFAGIAEAPTDGEARLARRLTIAHRRLAAALAPELGARGVEIEAVDEHPALKKVFDGLRAHVADDLDDGTLPDPTDAARWDVHHKRLAGRIAAELQKVDFRSQKALAEFFGGEGICEAIDGLGTTMHRDAYREWYAIGYRARKGRRTVAERMLAGDLPAPERRLLEARVAARTGIFQVADVRPPLVALRDVLSDTELEVSDGQLARNVTPGAGLPCQVADADGHVFVVPVGPKLPAGALDRAIDWLERRAGPITSAAVAARPQLLGALWQWAIEQHERPETPRLTNTDGDPLELQVATFRVADWGAVERAFAARGDVDRAGGDGPDGGGDAGARAEIWTWCRGTDESGTVLARLERVADELLLEVNSARRLRDARAWLEAIPGVAFAGARDVDLDEGPRRLRSRGGAPDELPPEALAQVQQHIDRQCMQWLDEVVPALGNRTPRQAVATPQGREAVLRLIRSWPDPGGIPGLKTPRERMRRELGLAAEGGGAAAE